MSLILVTGVNGFVGTHLTQYLTQNKHSVFGIGVHADIDPALRAKLTDYFSCDLTKADDVAKLPLEIFDGIINLAGLAAVGNSFDMPDEYMRVNTTVLSVICDEIVKRGLQSQIRMLAISSGTVYATDQPMPLAERSRTSASSSPYAASKLAMEELAAEYNQAGLSCIVARPFNHIGPGQSEGFLLPDLYAQLQEALSADKQMAVGNLTTQRDYTDVRDVVAAYTMLITAPTLNHQVYNVCSGTPRSGQEVLDALLRVTDIKIEVAEDPEKFRPSDSPVLYGDHTKLTSDTGWRPTIDFEKTIDDYVKSQA
jgi:GDP-4-dehydro-6-deoxy-D-mannose reductase